MVILSDGKHKESIQTHSKILWHKGVAPSKKNHKCTHCHFDESGSFLLGKINLKIGIVNFE